MKLFVKILGLALCAAVAGFLIFVPGIVEDKRNAVTPHDSFSVSAQAQALHDELIIGD